MTWTPERVEELTRLWSDGHSASAIGKLLGVSKNAVVGKAHRLQLPARPSPIKREASEKPAEKPTVTKAAPVQTASPVKAKDTANSPPETTAESTVAVAPKAKPAATSPQPEQPAAKSSTAPAATASARPARPAPKRPGRDHPVLQRRISPPISYQSCQWPIGDPTEDDFHFCGAPVATGKPYCAEHCQVAYIRKGRDNSSSGSGGDSEAAA